MATIYRSNNIIQYRTIFQILHGHTKYINIKNKVKVSHAGDRMSASNPSAIKADDGRS